jgi:agmatine deiminase
LRTVCVLCLQGRLPTLFVVCALYVYFACRVCVLCLQGRLAQTAFAAVANAIAQHEPVTMCVAPGHYASARLQLAPAVRLVEMSYNDAWMRDIAPTFVVKKGGVQGRGRSVRGVDWRFNG